eukprot:7331112-Heterocapsa_arctica.AAC.1
MQDRRLAAEVVALHHPLAVKLNWMRDPLWTPGWDTEGATFVRGEGPRDADRLFKFLPEDIRTHH